MNSREEMLEKKKKEVLLNPPSVILGKKGITHDFLDHLRKILKREKMVKVKALKSAVVGTKIDALAQEIAQRTNTSLIDLRGRTFILSKYSP
ncbi:MAG: CRS1 / YhbY (CRM) domain protein [Promethearchaeota archaeon]|nr:MAG: CRS1 / YhbY (CRM) domain protein [Candidatus Lokiarchaeota archaeon]